MPNTARLSNVSGEDDRTAQIFSDLHLDMNRVDVRCKVPVLALDAEFVRLLRSLSTFRRRVPHARSQNRHRGRPARGPNLRWAVR